MTSNGFNQREGERAERRLGVEAKGRERLLKRVRNSVNMKGEKR